MRIFKGLVLILMFSVAIAYWIGSRPKQEVNFDDLQEPKELSLVNLSGAPVHLSDYKGKLILLNFWASWCPPCVEELPSLLALADWAGRSLGVVTIAVSADKDPATVQKFIKEKKFWRGKTLPLTILMGKDTDIAQAYGTSKYPETFFIDQNFRIVRKFIGAQNWMSQEITRWMTELSKQ